MAILGYCVVECAIAIVMAHGRDFEFRQAYLWIEPDRLAGEPRDVHLRLYVSVCKNVQPFVIAWV